MTGQGGMTGSAPEWLAAIGTVGAFGVSLWLLWRAEQRRRREEKEKRSDQSRHVSAWVDGVEEVTHYLEADVDPYDPVEAVYGKIETRSEISYIVRNASGEPIYRVTLRMPLGTYGTFVRYLGTMGPEERRRVHVRVGTSKPVGEKAPHVPFTDSAGLTWYRGPDGILIELTKESYPTFTEEPGAYRSIEENPYMGELPPGEPEQGTKV